MVSSHQGSEQSCRTLFSNPVSSLLKWAEQYCSIRYTDRSQHHIQFQLRVVKVLPFHCFPRANWSSNFKTKRYCLYCSHPVLNSCHELRTVRLQVMRCTAHYGQCLSAHTAVTVSSRQICLPSYPLFCTVALCSIPARLISPKYFSFQYNAHCFWKTSESITSGSVWAQISHSACSKGAKIGRNY